MAELRVRFDPAIDYGRQLHSVRKSARASGAGAHIRKRARDVAITGKDGKLTYLYMALADHYRVDAPQNQER